jgi:type 1 glutamine amidotransferase
MCIRSQFILALAAFPVFAADAQKHVIFLVGDPEYKSAETVPAWARAELEPAGLRCTFIIDNPDKPFNFPELAELAKADALFISIKRRGVPATQMAAIRSFCESGKVVIGIRTASHAFEPKKPAPNEEVWPQFDREIFGGHYQNHYGKGAATIVKIEPKALGHQVLKGIFIEPGSFTSHLYRCRDLAPTTTVLLDGSISGNKEVREPVAWINKTQKFTSFYTSLGAPEDFQSEDFRRLLKNSTLFLLGVSVPSN